MTIWLERDFHVEELIGNPTEKAADVVESTDRQGVSSIRFKELRDMVLQYLLERHEKREGEEARKWSQMQHDAVVGKPEAERLFKAEIEEYLRENNYLGVQYPAYYKSLIEALFQETFGLGPVSTWRDHPKYHESQSARIFGKNIFFDIPGERSRQPFAYESEQQVIDNIIEKIKLKDDWANINKANPELEIDLEDGTRVMIMIPPRVRKPTIIFRHFTRKNPTFEDFVEWGTIPQEAVPLIKGINRTKTNMLAVGMVRSGKSTWIKACHADRANEDEVVVTVERNHSELKISDSFPEFQIIEMIVRSDEDYSKVYDLVLRSDFSYCIVPEMRSIEADIFLESCDRSEGGAMSSYHTEDVKNIPGQIARLLVKVNPNYRYEEEVIRVAEAIHWVYVFKPLPEGKKRLERISGLCLDPDTYEVSSHDIMRWDNEHQEWRYKFDVHERTLHKMTEADPTYAAFFVRTLKTLAAEKPILGSNVEVASSGFMKRG